MTYTDDERARATAWKAATQTLPTEAREAAPYIGKDGTPGDRPLPFCLPAAHADHNLLPEVRPRALALFAELGIPWHAGVAGGPSNHLLASQVQCANALTQMVDHPERLVLAFGGIVDIDEVLEIELGRSLTFEYIGPTDFFGEAPTGARVRGSHCTSVDAAFLVRAGDGRRELLLVEWKYTESYRLRRPDHARDAVRLDRYGAALADPRGPVRADLIDPVLLFDEPIYQLVRQQLLAHALEQAGVADRVRVLHVVPRGNEAYQQSLHRPEHRALGTTVEEVWQQLLRHPDRFTTVRPSAFLDPCVTSHEYVLRYAHDLVRDEAELCAAYGVEDLDGVRDQLDLDLHAYPGGVEVSLGREGCGFDYPFRVGAPEAQDTTWTWG